MKKILIGIAIGVAVVLFIPWLVTRCGAVIKIEGAEGSITLWQILNTAEGIFYGFIVHWFLTRKKSMMKKAAVLLCLVFLFAAGCSNYKETIGIALTGPVKSVSVKITAPDAATTRLFEKTIEDDLVNAGFVIDNDSKLKIEGIITKNSDWIIDYLIFDIEYDTKPVSKIIYEPIYYPIEKSSQLAKNISQRIIKTLKSQN
jgi:hypothetical protein